MTETMVEFQTRRRAELEAGTGEAPATAIPHHFGRLVLRLPDGQRIIRTQLVYDLDPKAQRSMLQVWAAGE